MRSKVRPVKLLVLGALLLGGILAKGPAEAAGSMHSAPKQTSQGSSAPLVAIATLTVGIAGVTRRKG